MKSTLPDLTTLKPASLSALLLGEDMSERKLKFVARKNVKRWEKLSFAAQSEQLRSYILYLRFGNYLIFK